MPHMGREKLTPDQRREIVLRAIRREYSTVQDLADSYGVARSWVYALLEEAQSDPEGKLREAEAEAEFRREVKKLLGNCPQNT